MSQRPDQFGGIAALEAIEEQEHWSSAATGSGDSAPARVLEMSNSHWGEFYIYAAAKEILAHMT
jgi:hypothetical protein